jgi:hypothetical protein
MFRCLLFQPQCDADVLFAGLAPGLAGTYQIDWRVPTGPAGSSFPLICQFGDTFPLIGSVPVSPSEVKSSKFPGRDSRLSSER